MVRGKGERKKGVEEQEGYACPWVL